MPIESRVKSLLEYRTRRYKYSTISQVRLSIVIHVPGPAGHPLLASIARLQMVDKLHQENVGKPRSLAQPRLSARQALELSSPRKLDGNPLSRDQKHCARRSTWIISSQDTDSRIETTIIPEPRCSYTEKTSGRE